MKKIMITGFILALSMLIIPFSKTKSEKKSVYTGAAVKVSAPAADISGFKTREESFRIKTGDKTVTLSAYNYIIGVVAAEMPVSYGKEALKAQCVAAYSFALYRKQHKKGADYDLTDSYKTDQSYLSEEALKEKWGKNYETNIEEIKAAATAVSGEYLSFGGAPALTLYHSVSSGKTNPCAEVFGSALPYLVSVNSKSDLLSPYCKEVLKFTAESVDKKLASLGAKEKEGKLKIVKSGESGCVLKVSYKGKTVSGVKLAELLSLPSPNFTVKYSSDEYTFNCAGRGHGVGLSQYGAGQMAQSGSDYREILAHYYPGTILQKNT